MPHVWLNGHLADEATAAVSARDAGLLHGAGVFTTMRAYGGRVFRLDEHLKRLRRSCEHLFVPLVHKDELIASAVENLLGRNSLTDARVRITITRGVTGRDPLHGTRMEPTTLITAAPFEPYPEDYYRSGLTVIVLDEQKANPYDIQAGHKTLDYFSRLAALKSAAERRAGEALWFNVHNYLQSGSISNVFIVKDGCVLTPPTPVDLQNRETAGGIPYPRSATLPGITRLTTLELADSAGVPTRIASIDINALLDADEVFLTNSIMGIMPVSRIEQHGIGDARPGPITQQLARLYEQRIRETSAP